MTVDVKSKNITLCHVTDLDLKGRYVMATRSTTMAGVTSGIAAKQSKSTRTVAKHRGRKSASPRKGSPGGAPAPKRARVSARSEGAAAKSHGPAKRKGKKTGRFDEKDRAGLEAMAKTFIAKTDFIF